MNAGRIMPCTERRLPMVVFLVFPGIYQQVSYPLSKNSCRSSAPLASAAVLSFPAFWIPCIGWQPPVPLLVMETQNKDPDGLRETFRVFPKSLDAGRFLTCRYRPIKVNIFPPDDRSLRTSHIRAGMENLTDRVDRSPHCRKTLCTRWRQQNQRRKQIKPHRLRWRTGWSHQNYSSTHH